ncbi:hypothetical protein CHUAL_002977 [Chamberlinius hualienensis]
MTLESQPCVENSVKDSQNATINGDINVKTETESNGQSNNSVVNSSTTRSSSSRQAKTVNSNNNNNVSTVDLTAQPSAACGSSLSDSETKKCGVGPTLRSSARVPKRPRDQDSGSTVENSGNNKKVATGCPKSDSSHLEQAKTRRTWELWSVEDKNSFFDALCEYGKDFENIQNYIVQKTRKKGHTPAIIKNKDQVRHFYYRTWHKISAHLNIDNDIKKQVQELYGLINYGELRKKIGGRLDEKNGQKLKELVHNGVTMVRCKGKNVRIKTPVCRALKKLNDVEDGENVKLPNRIVLEVRPRNNAAWSRVQSVSQNPRVRIDVSLQCRLAVIIRYLQERWRSHTMKQRDELISQCNDSDVTINHQQRNDSCHLLLYPQRGDNINPVCVKPNVEVSNLNVSLQNYMFKKGLKNKNKGIAVPLKVVTNDDRGVNESEVGSSVENNESEIKMINEMSNSLPAHEVTMRQLLALETAAEPITPSFLKDSPLSPTSPNVVPAEALKTEGCKKENGTDELGNKTVFIKPGWSANSCSTLTVGEVYLMLGRPQKLVVEYEWEYDSREPTRSSSSSTITSVLSRLLRLAANTYGDLYKAKGSSSSSNSSCRCGHVCPVSSTSSTMNKSSCGLRGNSKISKCGTNKSGESVASTSSSTTTTTTLNTCTGDVFRQPTLLPIRVQPKLLPQNEKFVPCDKVVKEQLDKFAQNRKAKGRMKKTVLVQRELPLLPKSDPNHSMMTLRIVPTASQLAGSFMPIMPAQGIRMQLSKPIMPQPVSVAPALTTVANTIVGSRITVPIAQPVQSHSMVVVADSSPIFLTQHPSSVVKSGVHLNKGKSEGVSDGTETTTNANEPNPVMSSVASNSQASMPAISSASVIPQISITESGSTTTMTVSPINISSLLDISLPGSDAISHTVGTTASDKLLDITLGNSTSDFTGFISLTNLGGVANLNKPGGDMGLCSLDSRPITPISSPTNSVFKLSSPGLEGHSWLNGDVSDFSLTNFLSHLESPVKTSTSNVVQNSSSSAQPQINIANELVSNFHGLMNENCIDYTSKFEDLVSRK